MCELFGFSSNRVVSLHAPLMSFRHRGGDTADNPDGWGVAHHNGGGFVLQKEPGAAVRSHQYARLAESIWSDLVIAHVRKANPPTARAVTNTHPFIRDCCARQWVFAHNGKVPELLQPGGCCHPLTCEPAGETDSEHAFCYLLDVIAAGFRDAAPGEKNAWFEALASASPLIARYGQFNFLMSDGTHLIAYGHDRLHMLEQSSNHHRTVLITSQPMDENVAWQAFLPGELRVFRAGETVLSLLTELPASDAILVGQADCKSQ